ncbi:MAG: ATP-dependent Clp protease proteolytic subunit, partial [Desulfarculus sp.]|nr:ATP-dependent Clp protease proteolytic subunit [Desulfarculus sp.]
PLLAGLAGLVGLGAWFGLVAAADQPAATPSAPARPAVNPAESSPGPVWIVELKDSVNPGSARFLVESLRRAAAERACLVVVQLDTPGGLVESMREMVQAILASPAPVAVYVAPSGARAASAGAFLVLAAQVAAMAPATQVGAAHPVGGGGVEIKGAMGDKVVQDLSAMARGLAQRRGRDPDLAQRMVTESLSLEAGEALKKGMIDLMASDLGSLLGQLEGVTVATESGPRVISTQGRHLVFHAPDWRDRLLSLLASPNLAYILLMIGLAGLYFELSHPGTIFPGVVGGLCLILAFFAMSSLPVSYAGLALILLSLVLFFLEIKVVSGGLLGLGGGLALILGSIMLFDQPGQLTAISLAVLVPTLAAFLAFFGGVTWLAARAQLTRARTGAEGLIGEKGVVLGPGRVRVLGEIWRARGAEGLAAGQAVVVKAVDGLTLGVEAVEETQPE